MEDDEMEFGTKKGRNAKTGRRAKKEKADLQPLETTNDLDGDTVEITETKTPKSKKDAPPRPSRRGGWGDESNKSDGTRRGFDDQEDSGDGYLSARLNPNIDNDEDSDNDIPVIPDLEETQEEENLTATVAMAPNIAVNRVATYRELDNDLLRHAAFVTLDNEIDLKLLTKGLSSDVDVHEEDKPWDWDRLFTEVTSDLIKDDNRGEGPIDDEGIKALP